MCVYVSVCELFESPSLNGLMLSASNWKYRVIVRESQQYRTFLLRTYTLYREGESWMLFIAAEIEFEHFHGVFFTSSLTYSTTTSVTSFFWPTCHFGVGLSTFGLFRWEENSWILLPTRTEIDSACLPQKAVGESRRQMKQTPSVRTNKQQQSNDC